MVHTFSVPPPTLPAPGGRGLPSSVPLSAPEAVAVDVVAGTNWIQIEKIVEVEKV